MRLLVFLIFLLCLPVIFMYAYQQGYLEGYVDDNMIPDEPFIQAELSQKTNGADLSTRINQALDTGNFDDAVMYEDVANFMGAKLNPDTTARLEKEKTLTATAVRNTGNFFDGFLTGNGSDSASFAGALTSDLTVVGDVRDIGTEGTKLIAGQDYSKLILGLSVVGLAATVATVATGGGGLPARAGVSLLKVAGKTGNVTKRFGEETTRLVSDAVNFPKFGETLKSVDLTDIAATRRVVSEYAHGVSTAKLSPLLDNVATLEKSVGPAESVRLMRHVESTDDLANLTKMSGKLGKKTRGIVEITGKTSLRAFKTAANLVYYALEWVWYIAGALGLALLRAIARGLRGGGGRNYTRKSPRFTKV